MSAKDLLDEARAIADSLPNPIKEIWVHPDDFLALHDLAYVEEAYLGGLGSLKGVKLRANDLVSRGTIWVDPPVPTDADALKKKA